MAHRVRLLITLPVVLAVCPTLPAQPAVPRVTCVNPVAGISIDIPEDWEMATNAWGVLNIGMEAGVGTSLALRQPQLWFFFSNRAPEQLANEMARAFTLSGAAPQVGPTGNGDEWQAMATVSDPGGPLMQRWLCRRQGTVGYAIGALVRTAVAADFQQDLDVALASAHLVPGPALQLFREPTENAYRMLLPQGWRWTGEIVRKPMLPGVFEWKVERPDGLAGAFNSQGVAFSVMYPYTSASRCAGSYVLESLRDQLPDVRLVGVQEFPRASAHLIRSIKMLGPGANPQVHKVRADYIGTVNGRAIRVRVDIATFMLDASSLPGGRGDWNMMVSGGWAPDDEFDETFPICRGIVASVSTDPEWKQRQYEQVWLDRYWKAWHRRFSDYKFIEGYLGRSYSDMPQLHDSDLRPSE